MAILSDLINKIRGYDPEQDEKTKQQATDFEAKYADKDHPTSEEPGVEEDYTLENLAATGLSPVGFARMGTKAASRGMIGRMLEEDKAPPPTLKYNEFNAKVPLKEGPGLNYGNQPKPTNTEATTGFKNPKLKYDEEPVISTPKFKRITK